MLFEILKTLSQEGKYSPEQLARSMDTTPELVREMVDKLVRLDYLKPSLMSSCSGGCSGCLRTCPEKSPLKLFSLTDKGRRAIQK
ncbi:MAG: FeoC-like transcriptional regulator [Tissierellia bacterium]|nr:FeoC-like transcriptional regulator [Tissierellia bacterium]